MAYPVEPETDDPDITDPVDRTRLAWTRTAIAFAAIGAAMAKLSPLVGGIVLVLTLPVWACVRRVSRTAAPMATPAGLRLVTATVLMVAVAALVVAFTGHGQEIVRGVLRGH